MAKYATAMPGQVFQSQRRTVPFQIDWRCANNQLGREQFSGNQALFGRSADSETDICPFQHPVADLIVEM